MDVSEKLELGLREATETNLCSYAREVLQYRRNKQIGTGIGFLIRSLGLESLDIKIVIETIEVEVMRRYINQVYREYGSFD